MTLVFDKPSVLRAHLNTAVAVVSLEEGFVSAHLIIMACEELLRMWYVKKDVYVPFDYRILTRTGIIKCIWEKYNFFKHADRDIDATVEVDPEEMHSANEMMLGLLISGYRVIFSTVTVAMNEYGKWLSVFYPDLILWDEMPDGAGIKAKISRLGNVPMTGVERRQVLRACLYLSGALPKQDLPLFRAMT
jgi:hypothetical protein